MASNVATSDELPLVERVRRAQLPPPHIRRAIRVKARATLRGLGAELGVTPMTVWRWESGATVPRLDHAIAYRELLDALSEATR